MGVQVSLQMLAATPDHLVDFILSHNFLYRTKRIRLALLFLEH